MEKEVGKVKSQAHSCGKAKAKQKVMGLDGRSKSKMFVIYVEKVVTPSRMHILQILRI